MRAQDQGPASTSRARPRRARDDDAAPIPFHPAMPLTPQTVLHLQRTIGNASLSRMAGQIRGTGPKSPWAARKETGSKRSRDDAAIGRGDSPPTKQQGTGEDQPTRTTRSGKAGVAKGKEEPEQIGNPTLQFTSRYAGDATQSLAGDNTIDFEQTATLRRADGMTTPAADAYDFIQEVNDENVQIVESDGLDNPQTSRRRWEKDGPYQPPYEDDSGNIDITPDAISFRDYPGFEGRERMTRGYWLKSYKVKFRWKVRRKRGKFWTSGEMVHQVRSEFDPANPEAEKPITATAAGNRTWDVELPD